jgi:hypothetical protein
MALSPGALGLFHAERESPFVTLEPLHLRVVAQEASSGKDFSIGNSLRLVDPYFPIGTWGSCAWGSGSQDLLMMRSLGISSVVGSLNPPASTSPYDFGMRSLDFAGEPPDINHSKVMVRRDDGRIVAIMLKDEPEWSKKMNAADVSAAQTLVSRLTSFLPTYLNMAVSKRFSEYATMADIASMDHYAYYAPLANDLPIPHRIAEAGWYMESLKRLAEPRPTWAWTQYAGWDRDPPGWSVENQAWQVLANGAKGLYWFSYGTGFADEYPEQTAAMARVNRQLELVKGVLLRGEPYKVGVDVQGSDPLLARVVAGPDAAVIVLVNQNDRASFRLTHFSYSMGSQNVQCDIQLPNWIPTDSTVNEITSEGAVATSLRPDAGRLRFATELANTRIYLVARKSATPPVAPVAVSKIAYPDGHHYLAWPEVADRTGIDHYEILADGIQVASVRTPFWAIPDDAINRSYSVRAVDTFGNVGQISFSNQVP